MAGRFQNYKQGVFNPLHPEKYIGTFPIIYRSGAERKVFRFFDNSSYVTKWASESIIIPYISPLDNKVHRYYCDFFMIIKDNMGKEHKYLVEYKPKRQCEPPTESKKKATTTLLYEKKQWVLNQAKWSAAKQFCEKNNMHFTVINETDFAKLS